MGARFCSGHPTTVPQGRPPGDPDGGCDLDLPLSPTLMARLGCLMQVEELRADNKMDCLAGTGEGGGTTGSPPSHSPATPALESLVNPGWGLPVTDAARVSLALSKERPRGSTELPAKPPCLGFLQKDQVRAGEGLLSHPTTRTPVHTRPGREQGIWEVDPPCPRGSLVPSGMHPQLRTSRRGGSLPRQPGPPPQPAALLSSLPTSFQVDLFLELQPPPPPSPSPPWATRSFLASLPSAVSRNHPGSKGAERARTQPVATRLSCLHRGACSLRPWGSSEASQNPSSRSYLRALPWPREAAPSLLHSLILL